jgi:hypothetical protein
MTDEPRAQPKKKPRGARRRTRARNADSRLQNWIDQAYTTLLVRDLFAKIAPGVLVLGALAVAVRGRQGARTLVELSIRSVAISGGLLALSWVVGMTIQIVGTRRGKTRVPSPGTDTARAVPAPSTNKSNATRRSRLWTEGIPGEEEHHRIRMKAMRRAIVGDRVHRERLVVAKEAGGNLFMALACSIPLTLCGLVFLPMFVGVKDPSAALLDVWTALSASVLFAAAAWACLQLNHHMALRQRSVELDVLAGNEAAESEYRTLHTGRRMALVEPWSDCKLCEDELRSALPPNAAI